MEERKMKKKERVYELLKEGKKCQKDIASSLNISSQSANNILSNLVKEGKAKREKEEVGKKKIFYYSLI